MPVDRTPQIIDYQNALIDRDRRNRDLEMLRKRISADVKRSLRETARMTERLRVAERKCPDQPPEVEVAQFRTTAGCPTTLMLVSAEGGLLRSENRRSGRLLIWRSARLSAFEERWASWTCGRTLAISIGGDSTGGRP